MTSPGAPWELETVTIKGRPQKVYKNLPGSIRDLFVRTKAFGPRDYIVYEDERYTYDQTHERVAATAELLRRRGVVKGDRVGICARNYPEWIYAFFATVSIGGVAVAINAWSPFEPLVHCFTSSGCKIGLIDGERALVLAPALATLRKAGCEHLFVVRPKEDRVPNGFERFDEAVKGCEGISIPVGEISPEDYATIYFTSGTTALPKGVLSTHRQFLSNLLNTSAAGARSALRRGESIPVLDQNGPQRSLLLSVPLFHVTGCQSLLFAITAAGGKVILLHKWEIGDAVKMIKRERVTTAGGVPHMVMELIDALEGDDDHAVEGFSFGGAPSTDRLPGALRKSIPAAAASFAYGLSEVNAVATSHSAEDYLQRPTSCGLATPATEIKIVCPIRKVDLPPHATGEIYIRGPNVAEGYWKNEEATKECFFDDGWFASGDLGHLDEEGWLYISDRAKEIIVRGGENISTVSVENALYRDERIKDAAVVPVPDAHLGELVAAVVVTKPQYHGQVSSTELMALVAQHLPKHCVPVLVVVREEEMPRNATGKILKRTLKDEVGKVWAEMWKGAGKAKL